MSENTFKVIETQEELDNVIKKRLAQKDRELEEKYKEWLSPEKAEELKNGYVEEINNLKKTIAGTNEKLEAHNKTVSELTERAHTAETALLKGKIAHEIGIPYELAGRLMGSNEEELKKDAETLASIIKPAHTAPLRTNEITGVHAPDTTKNAAMLGLLSQINEQMRSE